MTGLGKYDLLVRTQKAKETVTDIHGINILRLFDILPSFSFTPSKTDHDY